MSSRRHTILSLAWLIAAFSNVGWAKSLYVINDTAALTLQAYIIEGDQVDYQAQVDIDTYNPGFGV
jgi:hypothetical protein